VIQKNAVVMGGGRGIGEAIVRRFSNDGYAVTVIDCLKEEAESVAKSLRDAGRSAFAETADITDAAQLDTVMKRVAARGPVHAAINSVGVFNERRMLIDTDLAAFKRVLDVNLTGAFIFTVAVQALMAENSGIVHIGSVNGVIPGKELGAYKVSKAGLHMMAKCLALELAADPRRIRVNVVAPGWVDTPGERIALVQEPGKPHPLDNPKALDYIPMGRKTEAREVADSVAFLCSDQASAITGQILFVDCGVVRR